MHKVSQTTDDMDPGLRDCVIMAKRVVIPECLNRESRRKLVVLDGPLDPGLRRDDEGRRVDEGWMTEGEI